MVSERDIQAAMMETAEALGCLVVRHHSQGNIIRGRKVKKGNNGIWDFYGCLPTGRFFAVECKAPGAVTKKDHAERQQGWGDKVLDRNGIWVQSDDPKELEEILASFIENG